MLPLNYAMLKYYTHVDEASVDDVISALKDKYGNFKAFSKDKMTEAVMTAEKNGLLEETRYEYDKNHKVRIYYHANDDGTRIINSYIKQDI
jgi:DNA-binding PadR family transcriptional regulator